MRNLKLTRPTQVDDDAKFPVAGKARNIAFSGDNTGTPHIEDIINDRQFGWQENILKRAGVVANGSPEDADQSQIAQAVEIVAAVKAQGKNLAGSSRYGCELASVDDWVIDNSGEFWEWQGGYPKTVTAGETPSSPTWEVKGLKELGEVLKANLIAQGLSGDYGFFSKGFVYNLVGDVGIDVDGKIYTYAGIGPLPVDVVAGTVPSDFPLTYQNIEFNAASSIIFKSGESVEDLKSVIVTSPSEVLGIPSALKSNSGGSIKLAYNENLQLSQVLTFTGEFAKGFTVDGGRNRFTTALGTSGLLVDNKSGDIASEYFNKAKFVDFEFIGSGATASPVSYGFTQRAAAGINTYNLRTIDFNIGMLLDGALTSNHYSPVVRSNGIGINAKPFVGSGGLNSFSPNANNFFGAQIQRNDQAVNYDNNPSGAVNWFGVTVEANNIGGNDTDGVKVFQLTNAGHHNIIGSHFESNLGQYGIWFDGTSANKNLLVAGSEIIHETDTVLHVEKGILTAVASRITNNGATNDINLQVGASATLIDSEARVSGDLSKTVGIKFGRIKFGGNPVDIEPLISATPSAIVGAGGQASSFSSNSINHTWRNSAGARMGVMSFSDGGNWAFTKDGTTGYSFNANGTVKFYIGRGGSNSIEPGSDNSISFGSATFRPNQIFAVSGTINTSDEREKTDIKELTDELLAVGKRLMKINKTYKWTSSVADKGDSARTHVGLIAQEVIEAFECEGLNAFDYGAVCYDEWDDQWEDIPEELDDEGNIIQERKRVMIVEAGNRYGLRFQQLNELRLAYINSILEGLEL